LGELLENPKLREQAKSALKRMKTPKAKTYLKSAAATAAAE